jgi:hypothetical protein
MAKKENALKSLYLKSVLIENNYLEKISNSKSLYFKNKLILKTFKLLLFYFYTFDT